MEHVVVSACLMGVSCRWHGKKCYTSTLVSKFWEQNPDTVLIPVCPECLGGLPVPRPPVKVRKGRVFETCEDKAQREHVTGKELTREFKRGAEKTLEVAQKYECKTAILFCLSPSCSVNGIAGKLLKSNGIKVIPSF